MSEEISLDAITDTEIDKELKNYVDEVFSAENVEVMPGLQLTKLDNVSANDNKYDNNATTRSLEDYFHERLDSFAKSRLVSVNVQQTARFLYPSGETSTSKPIFFTNH